MEDSFKIHEVSIALRAKQIELLSSNIANQDTPGYKARDLDFRAIMNEIQNDNLYKMTLANEFDQLIHERPSKEPSLDGNTVDSQIENAKFAESSVRYLASVRFVEHNAKNLLTVFRGE